MVTNRKTYGKSLSLPAGIGIGIGITILMILSGCTVVAFLLNRETLGMELLGYGAMVVLLLSSYVGAIIAAGLIKRRRLMVCGIHALITLLILLVINGIGFGGSVSGLGATIALLLGGAGCAVLTNPGGNRKRRRKLKIRTSG